MNKAIYLISVFLMPLFTTLFFWDNFQKIMVWLYIPAAVAYASFIWFQPHRRMIKLITLTPFVFLFIVLLFFSILAAMKSGLSSGLKLFSIVAIAAVPSAIVVGAVYVLLAYALFLVFKKYGWLPSNR